MTGDGADPRAEAFAWAEHQRRARAALRDELRSGSRTLDDVLGAPADGDVARTKLLFVLESLPGASKVRTRRRLAELGIDDQQPVGALDGPTRAVLAAEFPLDAAADRSAS